MLARLRDSGPLWMVLACLCFSTMGLFVKLGSQEFSTPELVLYRSLVALLLMGALALPRGRTLRVPRPMLRLHLTRSVLGSCSMLLFFYAIAHLPLPTAITLQNTSPLFLMLIGILWLHMMPGRSQALAIGLGFVGVVLLLRPTLASEQWVVGMLGLLSGLAAAAAQYNIHELGKAGEPEWRIVFYFSLVSGLFALVWMLLRFQLPAPLTLKNMALLLGLALFATAGQYCLTRAFRKGKSLVVASLSYLTVAITSLYGVIFWGDVLPLTSYAAMGLIALAGVLSSWRGSRS